MARIVDHDNPRPSMEAVDAARQRLRGVAVRAPLLQLHGKEQIWLKPEILQPTRSFKVRGIYNAVAALSDEERAKGVSIVSSGNAAQALAWTARRFGIRARAIMPRSAPQAKMQSFIALGGQPELRDPERAFDMLLDRSYTAEPDTFIHPTANPDVVAGFGSIALEILEDMPDVEEVWVPVGGGGLISGIANVLRERAPSVRVVGVQPATCTPIIQGVQAGEPVITACDTFCDGVAGNFMDPDTWPLLRDLQPDWATASEEAVLATIRRLALGNKLIVEGSGALSVAAALNEPEPRKRVCILSGGSIDPDKLSSILESGSDTLSEEELAEVMLGEEELQRGSYVTLTDLRHQIEE